MPQTDFAVEILETEIVLTAYGEGHVYHFPIVPNGTVSLNGPQIESNPKATREARKYLGTHRGATSSLAVMTLPGLSNPRASFA
jgi:hypothetical protein